MKPKYIRLIAFLMGAVIALSVVAVFSHRISGSESDKKIYIYHNDTRWNRANLPVHVNDAGNYYAPLTFFVQIGGVKARVNEVLQTFLITNGDHYLSFDVTSNYAANEDKIRIPLKTYEYEGERYVPIDAVCFYLHLGFDSATSKKTGETVLRVSNGRQQYSFRELVERRHPAFYETDPASKPTASGTVKPPASTEAEKLTDRVIYITVEVGTGEYVDGILEALESHNCKASFFVDVDWCSGNIPTLMKILTGGHSVAFKGSDQRNVTADELVAKMEEGNEILSIITKYKTRVRSTPYSGYIPQSVSSAFVRAGYTLWTNNVRVPASGRTASAGAKTVIDGIWNNSVCSVGFEEGRLTGETLEQVLEFIDGNRSECSLRTVGASASQ